MMTLMSDLYLRHEWVFWPFAVIRCMAAIADLLYSCIVWLPRLILQLIESKPSMIIELISTASALLFTVWAPDVRLMWKMVAGLIGLAQLTVLVINSWSGRVKVMIVATVFWWCLTLTFFPRRFGVVHAFLIPLCWAYAVTALSLLRHCDDRRFKG